MTEMAMFWPFGGNSSVLILSKMKISDLTKTCEQFWDETMCDDGDDAINPEAISCERNQ